ncbi:DUF742 domain-containing protein [Streptomyces sp. WM6386]|uniref:DUF742 domain-containing protein n=1 Tax=Streptomyces sp. WM6386 TaxID=1415558 RepID=UPI000619FBCE|nr:DUF742 domain-containing protein [Streptomyces sp. WM6386]KKD06675.1 hypothetical protein TN53_17945 [Streptomyces sp. WM6386]
MNHWTDASEDEDAEQGFVRPYTITQGRTVNARADLTLITMITTVAQPVEQLAARALQPEHRVILQQCRTPVALAEVAAELNLPVVVTKILIADLLALGGVTARPPLAVAVGQSPDMTLLQAVRDGLLRL